MKIRCLAWLLPLFFCCCHKSKDNSSDKNMGFTFTTTYDSVISGYAGKSYIFPFNIDVLTGSISGHPVTYSITGLPANVTVTPGSQSVQDQLSGIFTFTIGDVPPGNDTINFVISSSVYGTQNRKLILNILALPDYATKLAGTYPHSYDFCSNDSLYPNSSVVSTITGTPYGIKISKVRIIDTTFTVAATVSNIVTIPAQTIGSFTTWGTGNFTHDNPPYDTLYQMTIYDTTARGLDTQYATIHIQH